MKNKLVKANKTKFDYRARKLGIIGLFLMVITLSVAVPVASSLSNVNKSLVHDITVMENENNDSNLELERK
jgi:hypothetical protein